jgi:hypothetical protein
MSLTPSEDYVKKTGLFDKTFNEPLGYKEFDGTMGVAILLMTDLLLMTI